MRKYLILAFIILSSCISNTKKDPTENLPYKKYHDYKIKINLNVSDSSELNKIKEYFNTFNLDEFEFDSEEFEFGSVNSIYTSISFLANFDSISTEKILSKKKSFEIVLPFDLNKIKENLIAIFPDLLLYGNNNIASNYYSTSKILNQVKEDNPTPTGIKISADISGPSIGVFHKHDTSKVISLIKEMSEYNKYADSIQLFWNFYPSSSDSLELFLMTYNSQINLNLADKITKIKLNEKSLLKILDYDKNDIPTDWFYDPISQIEIFFNEEGFNTFSNILENSSRRDFLFCLNRQIIADYYVRKYENKKSIEFYNDLEYIRTIIWILFFEEFGIDKKNVTIKVNAA